MSDVNYPDGEVEPEFQSLLDSIRRSRGFDLGETTRYNRRGFAVDD